MGYLKLENISKKFGKTEILKSINLEITEGTFFVILGPSGCGKSTLLNIIAGLEDVSSGRVFLDGKDITAIPPDKRDMAMVFQNYALYPHLSVFENMAFGLRARGEKKDVIEKRVNEVSRILNVEDKLKFLPKELSGGQKQRVATGRAMVREPKLFLFDEPLSNLDARLRIEMRMEFKKLHTRLKKTMVYVTHDQVEALTLGDMVVVLKDGLIQQLSQPEKLYTAPENLFIARFVGTPPMNVIELAKFKLPQKLMIGAGKKSADAAYFGFRPSACRIEKAEGVKGEVLFTEAIGENRYAYIKLAEGVEVNVKTEEETRMKPGEIVFLNIDPARMYFFDRSGKRM